jgi:hypothetical protein
LPGFFHGPNRFPDKKINRSVWLLLEPILEGRSFHC